MKQSHSSHYVALWPKVPYLSISARSTSRVSQLKLAASESFESRKQLMQQLKGKLSLIGGCCAEFFNVPSECREQLAWPPEARPYGSQAGN